MFAYIFRYIPYTFYYPIYDWIFHYVLIIIKEDTKKKANIEKSFKFFAKETLSFLYS